MPRLPDVNDLGARPVPQSRRNVVSVRNAGAMGEGLSQIGRTVAGVGDDLRAADDQMDVARSKADFLRRKIELENTLDADPDFETHEKRYVEGLNKAKAASAEMIRNRRNRSLFEVSVAPEIEQGVGVIRGQIRAKKKDASRAELIDQESQLIDTALAAKDQATRESAISTFTSLLDAKVAAGDITAQEAAQARLSFTERYGLGRLDKMSDADAVKVLRGSLSQEKPLGAFVDFIPRDKRQNLLEAAEARLVAEQRRREAEARQRASEQRQAVRDSLEDLRWSLSQGVPVEPARINGAINAAQSIGSPELARSIGALGIKNQTVTIARTMSPVEVQGAIGALNTKIAQAGPKANPADLIQRDALQTTLTAMSSATKNDPLSWASLSGVVGLTPIDPDSLNPAALKQRRSEARAVASKYGVSPKFLTDSERTAMKARLDGATPSEKVSIARALASGLGADSSRAMREISTDGVFAHAGSLARLDNARARNAEKIFAGQEIAKSNPQILPTKGDVSALASERLGNALSLSASGRSAALASANALYAFEASKRGLTRDSFDEDLWESALNQAVGGVKVGGDWIGGVHERRGVQVVLPTSMTADAFDDALDALSDADIARVSVGGAPPKDSKGRSYGAKEIKKGYLWDAGGGRYYLSADKQGTAFYRGSGPGGLFVLDATKMK